MDVNRIGISAAVLSSICCIGPLLLAGVGLGGFGIGAWIGIYHWHFMAVAGLALGLAWYFYLRERRRCKTERCEMARGNATRVTLSLATLVVLGFLGLNVYSYAGDSSAEGTVPGAGELTVEIPVEGMTCVSCTITVERRLNDLIGVAKATASVPAKSVTVNYDPTKVNIGEMVEAVSETGFRARMPEDAT